jgi:hypothetical protein
MAKIVDFKGSNPKQKNEQIGFNVDPTKLQTVSCPNCNGIFFEERMMFKELPAIQSPTGQASMIPIPVVICSECGTVHPKFVPKGLFNDVEEKKQ